MPDYSLSNESSLSFLSESEENCEWVAEGQRIIVAYIKPENPQSKSKPNIYMEH